MSDPFLRKSNVVRQSLYFQGFKPERIEEITRGGRFEHFILSRSKCEVRHERWECGGFSVDAASYNFAARACGVFTQDRFGLGYIRNFPKRLRPHGSECDLEAIQLYPPGCEVNYRASPGGAWVAIECDEASLQRGARKRFGHEIDLPRNGPRNLMVPRAGREMLERMVELSLRKTAASCSMIEPIIGAIVELLSHEQTGNHEALAGRWQRRESLLSKAELFLRSNITRPFESKVLATAVGTTERSVQKYFLEAYGITPGQWARCLALHHARKRLLVTHPTQFTVEGIALELGFRHMGRFAGHYEALFGEYPSATLSRPAS